MEKRIQALIRRLRADPEDQDAINKIISLAPRIDYQLPDYIVGIIYEFQNNGKKLGVWYQISGDINPVQYSAILAKQDAPWADFDLWNIDNIEDSIGPNARNEIGRPFWISDSYLDLEDLDYNKNKSNIDSSLESLGWSADDINGRDWDELTNFEKVELLVSDISWHEINVSWGNRNGENPLPPNDGTPIVWYANSMNDMNGRNLEHWSEADRALEDDDEADFDDDDDEADFDDDDEEDND